MNRREHLKALAVDFDGVLVDTQPLHLLAWHGALRERGITIASLEERILGMSVGQFIASLKVDAATAIDLAKRKKEHLLCLADEELPALFSGVRETLDVLAGSLPIALVSSAEKELVWKVLRGHGIEHYFSMHVLEGDFSRPKPDPEPYRIAAYRLGVSPGLAAAIEDSPVGVLSASAAGLFTVAVSNTALPEALRSADVIVSDFSEVPTALGL